MVPTRVKGQLFQIAIMHIIEYYSSLENMSVYYLNQKHFYLKQVLREAFGAQARLTVISDIHKNVTFIRSWNECTQINYSEIRVKTNITKYN